MGIDKNERHSRRHELGPGKASPFGNDATVGGGTGSDNNDARGGTQSLAIYELLSWFCYRIDGYLRIIPDGNQRTVHVKWKYTRSRWEGHYAYVSGEAYDLSVLLWKLRDQLEDHDAGLRAPTKDKPYQQI